MGSEAKTGMTMPDDSMAEKGMSAEQREQRAQSLAKMRDRLADRRTDGE